MRTRFLVVPALLGVLALGACGGEDESPAVGEFEGVDNELDGAEITPPDVGAGVAVDSAGIERR